MNPHLTAGFTATYLVFAIVTNSSFWWFMSGANTALLIFVLVVNWIHR